MTAAIKHRARKTGFTLSGALRSAQQRFAASGIEDGALEAEVLLAHMLGATRAQLFAALDAPLTTSQHDAFSALVERRFAHEPLPYIVGHREFYGIDLLCTPAALIPRPETELLVELALGWAKARKPAVQPPTIFDVGTGSGAIAIAIAVHASGARVIASDTSAAALALAARNASRAGVADRIDFVRGPLLAAVRRADVIVANLPYISDDVYAALPPELHREPEGALRAGPRGTELIEALLSQARDVLAPGGLLVAEHAYDQGASLRATAAALFPDARVETKRDLAGLERALVVARP